MGVQVDAEGMKEVQEGAGGFRGFLWGCRWVQGGSEIVGRCRGTQAGPGGAEGIRGCRGVQGG